MILILRMSAVLSILIHIAGLNSGKTPAQYNNRR